MVSFVAGVALLFMSVLVMVAYWPSRNKTHAQPGAFYLGMAIWLGFLTAGLNTLFWQVIGQPAVRLGWISVADIRAIGDWVDLFVKGGAAYAGWLHLRAIYETLDDEEKSYWSVLEMAFYPRRRACLRLLCIKMKKTKE